MTDLIAPDCYVTLTTMDNIYISEPTAPSLFSDHYEVYASIGMPKKLFETKTVRKRQINDINLERFKQDLTERLASISFNSTGTVDGAVDAFNDTICHLLDEHAPETLKTTRNRPKSPWYDNDIHVERQSKRRLERKWKTTKSVADLQAFIAKRKSFNDLLDRKKSTYYQNIVQENHRNQRQLYQIFADICHRKRDMPMPEHDDAEELANCFSEYFGTKINAITSNFTPAEYVVQQRPLDPARFSVYSSHNCASSKSYTTFSM